MAVGSEVPTPGSPARMHRDACVSCLVRDEANRHGERHQDHRHRIEALGGRLEDVVRTRMFMTGISRWEEVGAAHGELFAAVRPATTMVEVAKLIDDAALVEIEADAIVG